MDEVKVLDIEESPTVGRWVLATIGGYDDSVSYELTFAPDLGLHEWDEIASHLPSMYRIVWLAGGEGTMLGRPTALMALIT